MCSHLGSAATPTVTQGSDRVIGRHFLPWHLSRSAHTLDRRGIALSYRLGTATRPPACSVTVTRRSSSRLRGSLTDRRRDSRRRFHEGLVDVTPCPVFPGLETADDGVARGVKVRSRMPAGRVVAAPHVAARQAEPEVFPPATGGKAVRATLRGSRIDVADLLEVVALLGHRGTPQLALPIECSAFRTARGGL